MIDALLATAKAHLDHDRPDDALASLREAARLSPGRADIHHDIGYLLLRLGHFAAAADSFGAAILAEPGFNLAQLRRGIALQAMGDREGALAAYDRAVVLDPGRADAPFRAGILLEALGRRASALAALQRAAATQPPSALSRLADARLLLDAGGYEAAEQRLRALLDHHPGHLEGTDTLGALLADLGRFAEARSCFEHVTRTSAQYAGSFYDLVRCRRIDRSDAALVERMTATAARPELHAEARVRLHLALGWAADDLDRPGEAMRQFGIASAFRIDTDRQAAAQIERHVDRAIGRSFKTWPVRSGDAAGVSTDDPGRMPILVVGLPRSGTTLVEQILSCHPEVGAAGELPFWFEQTAVLDEADPAARAEAAAAYLRLLRSHAPAARRVTDKMPLNVLHLGLIRSCLPGAGIVLCRRRSIDVALSIHRTHFNRDSLVPSGGDALVHAIRAVERLSAHWRQVLPPDRLHVLDYEQLVAAPRDAVAGLLSFCELSWNDACLRPERNRRVVRTPSRWQVRQPIKAPAPENWRRYEPWLGPLAALC